MIFYKLHDVVTRGRLLIPDGNPMTNSPSSTESRLYKKALGLEYFTAGYNILEAAASLAAGAMASSIALTGFGLDSVVESLSGAVLIWRLGKSGVPGVKAETRAVQFVGGTFWILAVWVLVESVRKIIGGKPTESSPFGIAIAAVSVLVMPALGWMKLKIGNRLGLESLVADSKETFVCALLSAALLLGLVCRMVFGFQLADPLVGLFIAVFLFKEGRELLFEDRDCEDRQD
jgi:divalent metal cation (Fe/Co/Zn/Cd) transporter